ncbi:carboxylesterase family protein [Hyphococcus formosus]|uniref:carboxylesterase/lipase family protein n=1 Tax=Hyphococcus formosus TaxID=3143534 RepID=UPI00398A7B50
MLFHRRELLGKGIALGASLTVLGGGASAISTKDLFPIVETENGKLRGFTSGGVHAFKGVRYGADTSGKNRFMPPAPPPKWAGIQDALDYGQVPPQGPDSRIRDYAGLITFDVLPGGMGEDCLNLNIWTPTLDQNAKRPVILSLHGGGFSFGSGNQSVFDGEALARYGDCIVVTVSHRLGAFGFIKLSDHDKNFATSSTAGMQDLVAALRWVKTNIESFGGDPNRVLIFGQSGGGAKTSTLMAMPSAQGLFHRAGVMSGSLLRSQSQETAQENTHLLAKELGIGKRDLANKLQQLSFQDLLAAQLTITAIPGRRSERQFAPSIDDELPTDPFDPSAPDISKDIPMIIGTTLDEWTFLSEEFDLSEASLLETINEKVGEDNAADLLSMYRDEDFSASPYIIQGRYLADSVTRVRANLQAGRKAAQGGAPVWTYLWSAPSPAFGGRYGATHSADLGPSFRNPQTPLSGATIESARLADQISSCWVSFAATGNPNHDLIPHWPNFNSEDRSTLIFDRRTHVENDPRSSFRTYWEST